MAAAAAPALFAPVDGGYRAAPMTHGPWEDEMMHGGAPSALLAHAVQSLEPGSELMVSRLTIELLGGVPIGDVSVEASLAKPGRRFQVVEAALDAGGRRACLARAVRMRRADMPEAAAGGLGADPLPGPEEGEAMTPWVTGRDLFYPDATEMRQVTGVLGRGHAAAWVRLRGDLLPGVPPPPLARAAAAADFANGLSWVLPIADWLFVNTELTIHLFREPQGEWIGLDARTASSSAGVGLATGVLHDLDGPFGTCAESLFVERR